jgi:hypothetical protein
MLDFAACWFIIKEFVNLPLKLLLTLLKAQFGILLSQVEKGFQQDLD